MKVAAAQHEFLDADVKRSLDSASAIVDEGNRAIFGATESYIGHVGQSILVERKRGVFILQSTKAPRSVTFDGSASTI